MCGIAGIVYPNSSTSLPYRNSIGQMLKAIRHRGPDETGIHEFRQCTLGHNRLSIVDLATGQQPMVNQDNSIGLTFNGEIYGYKTIRQQLSKDYQFATDSDTEVLLALYNAYGINFVHHMPGMFAFAIWDNRKNRLFCARDRFGEKPFYYARGSAGELIFASEIKSIIKSGLIRPVIDSAKLPHYLQRLYVSPAETVYKNIHTLPPGYSLVFENGEVKISRYWELPIARQQISLFEATEEFDHLFRRAVQNQLVADVEVGAFLSGGLDSSSVVAVGTEYHQNLSTISCGFSNEISELPFARLIANKYRTNHHEIVVTQQHIPDLLLKMQEIYDEPFADSSNIPTYLICQEASKLFKVVITGDGGDEMLGGYDFWYRKLLNVEDATVKESFPRRFYQFMKYINKIHTSRARQLQVPDNGQFNGSSTLAKHLANINYFSNEEIYRLGLPALNGEIILENYSNSVDDAIRYDILNYLPGDILTKTDRASMANSLELRAPFLDVDLASFCISLPSNLKINSKDEKILLKSSFGQLLPQEIITRKKQGFGSPIKCWLKIPGIVELSEDIFENNNSVIYQIIDKKAIEGIPVSHYYKRWAMLVLAVWLEKNPFEIA